MSANFPHRFLKHKSVISSQSQCPLGQVVFWSCELGKLNRSQSSYDDRDRPHFYTPLCRIVFLISPPGGVEGEKDQRGWSGGRDRRAWWWQPYLARKCGGRGSNRSGREQSHGQAAGRSALAERVLREVRARSFYSTVRMGSQGTWNSLISLNQTTYITIQK